MAGAYKKGKSAQEKQAQGRGGTRDPFRCLRPRSIPSADRASGPDQIPSYASLSDACGTSREDAGKHPIYLEIGGRGNPPKPSRG
ncbi:5-Hydroxytryptamine Receptor 3B [Manis pentadactyla]|nr:5-Hydroxytryptamine Receptor 3B [Manis pentadactyla]